MIGKIGGGKNQSVRQVSALHEGYLGAGIPDISYTTSM
jgi:hypothetical protein